MILMLQDRDFGDNYASPPYKRAKRKGQGIKHPSRSKATTRPEGVMQGLKAWTDRENARVERGRAGSSQQPEEGHRSRHIDWALGRELLRTVLPN